VNFRFEIPGRDEPDIIFEPQAFVGTVRKEIAAYFGLEPRNLILKVGSRLIEDDSVFLRDLGTKVVTVSVDVPDETNDTDFPVKVRFQAEDSGKFFVLRFTDTETVAVARGRVGRALLASRDRIQLLLSGKILKDGMIMGRLRVPAQKGILVHVTDIRELMIQTAKGMRMNTEFGIVVLAKDGVRMNPMINRATTIEELNELLSSPLNLPPDGFGLIFDEKFLADGELGDLGIEPQAKVLVTREGEDYEITDQAEDIDPWEEELFTMVSISELVALRGLARDHYDSECIVLYIRGNRDLSAVRAALKPD
jgi:hypothetical protein